MSSAPVSRLLQQGLAALLFGAAYAGLSLVWTLQSDGAISNLVWLPAGLGAAALARWPSRWPGVLAGLIVVEVVVDVMVFAPDQPRYWVQWPIVNLAAALAGWWTLKRTGADRLDAPGKMVGLVLAGSVTSVIFGLSFLLDGSSVVSALTATLGDLAGFLIVAPVVLSLARDRDLPTRRALALLGGLAVGLLALWAVPDYSTQTAPWVAVMIAVACAVAAAAGIEIGSVTLIFVLVALTDTVAFAGFLDDGTNEWSGALVRLAVVVFVTGIDTLALLRDAAVAREATAEAVHRELERVAATDALTGVGNRRAVPANTGDVPGSAVLLDIDDLKRINDSFDHLSGDQAIVHFATVLSETAPDGTLIARLGGDEFLAVCWEDQPEVEAFVARFSELLSKTEVSRDLPLPLTASVRIAEFDPDSDTWEAIQRADLALMQAKARRGGPTRFHEAMRESAASTVEVEARLSRALRDDGVRAYVQPIIDMTTGEVEAFEVLARLLPPGSPGPDQFIPVAMRTGMGRALEAAILRNLVQSLDVDSSTPLSINSSPQNLLQPEYSDWLLGFLAEQGISPGRIILEVTEDEMVTEHPIMARTVAKLREAGIQLALDDFGTRSSALTAVTTLNPQIVKIDISFVQASAAGDDTATAVIQALVVMAGRLGMKVVAEGVETVEQSRHLSDLGITLQQGFLFARPMPAEDWSGLPGGRIPPQADGPASGVTAHRR